MDLKQRLLQNEIQHLGQIIQTLSYELIVLQDFLTDEFGPKFEKYRKNYSENDHGPYTSSLSKARIAEKRPSGGNDERPKKMVRTEATSSTFSEAEVEIGETKIAFTGMAETDLGDDPLQYDDESSSEAAESLRIPIDDAETDSKSTEKKGGRKRTRIWQYFDKVSLGDNKVSVRCHNCGGLVSSRASRMVDHHIKCSKRLNTPGRKSTSTTRPRHYTTEIHEEVMKSKGDGDESGNSEPNNNPNSQGQSSTIAETALNNFDGDGGNTSEEAQKKISLEPQHRVRKMGRTGRSQDVIWTYFKEVKLNGMKKAKCLACGDYISPKADRLRHHKSACEEVGGLGEADSD